MTNIVYVMKNAENASLKDHTYYCFSEKGEVGEEVDFQGHPTGSQVSRLTLPEFLRKLNCAGVEYTHEDCQKRVWHYSCGCKKETFFWHEEGFKSHGPRCKTCDTGIRLAFYEGNLDPCEEHDPYEQNGGGISSNTSMADCSHWRLPFVHMVYESQYADSVLKQVGARPEIPSILADSQSDDEWDWGYRNATEQAWIPMTAEFLRQAHMTEEVEELAKEINVWDLLNIYTASGGKHLLSLPENVWRAVEAVSSMIWVRRSGSFYELDNREPEELGHSSLPKEKAVAEIRMLAEACRRAGWLDQDMRDFFAELKTLCKEVQKGADPRPLIKLVRENKRAIMAGCRPWWKKAIE